MTAFRFSAHVLVATPLLVGLLFPAPAAAEEPPSITLNGRSLVDAGLVTQVLNGHTAGVTLPWVGRAPAPQVGPREDRNWWARRSNKMKGLLIGSGVGAGIGLYGGVGLCNNEGGVRCDGRAQAEYSALGGLIGAGIGLGIGALLD